MMFDTAGAVEEQVWVMREADLTRSANRTILNEDFNGKAPYDESKADENHNEINVNFLEGPNLMAQANRQWRRAMLGTGNYYSVNLDIKSPKRGEWSRDITRFINRYLKRADRMEAQIKSEGANTLLHGIAPSIYDEKRNPYIIPIFPGSLLIPSDTDRDMLNLNCFAIFREWTPAQLAEMTCGPRRDPGWNMPKVNAAIKDLSGQTQKKISATAYQYMPERIEELRKGDLGFWGSDAVPTVDAWDFYFRDDDDGKGWYRRTILDWAEGAVAPVYNPSDPKGSEFLYSSGRRKYANYLCEILHVNFGDLSCVAPFKYHSTRGLGWMLQPICQLQNRLRCRFTESVFQQLMWFFRTAAQGDMERIKMAQFRHMGVIPQGIAFVTANERFKPDQALVEMAIAQNRQMMSENAAAFIQDFEQGRKAEMTATETMARVNTVNAMVSGVLADAYRQASHKFREQARRFCMKHSPFADVRNFRRDCLAAGIPEEALDVERWDIEPEKVMGGGNKTLEIAQANQLMAVRKNLNPDAQRKIDKIFIEVNTDDPALAQDLAPDDQEKPISNSTHDAQLATERILRGLPFTPPSGFVAEDYIRQWLQDLTAVVKQVSGTGNVGTLEQVIGMQNLAAHVQKALAVFESNEEEKAKVKEYADVLGKLNNAIKGFAQRLQEQMQKQQGANGGMDPKDAAKIQGMMLQAKVKADNARKSHAERTAQKRISFEQKMEQDAQKHALDVQQGLVEHGANLAKNRMTSLQE